jgi:hypothetical protein
VRKVDSSGKLKLQGRNWNISQALAGDWVQLVRLEERVQVYYCNPLIRELDLASPPSARRSSSAGRRATFRDRNCKACPETLCKACPGTGHDAWAGHPSE